jgi:PAS domain S-box-containing protein
MKRTLFIKNIQYSVWLATLTVIILIVLLALTINHAREKAILEQFSRQQATIANTAAAGIEDFISGVEKTMIILSKEYASAEDTLKNIHPIYDELDGKVQLIAGLDENGIILYGYPVHSFDDVIKGNSFEQYPFFHEMKRLQRAYTGLLTAPKEAQDRDKNYHHKFIVICIPEFTPEGRFNGAVLATISLQKIFDRYMSPVKKLKSNNFWMIDNNGVFILHSNPEFIGKNIKVIMGDKKSSSDNLLPKEQVGYGEYLLKNNKGKIKRHIIGYAPIHLGQELLSISFVNPHDTVMSLIRKALSNIMLGAAGLILVIIIAGMSITSSIARGSRLKERGDWQEKLLREKKTVEGILEGSPVPAFVIDKEHKAISWNRACAALTGYEAKDIIGTDKYYLPFYTQKRPVFADFIVDSDIDSLCKYYGTNMVHKSDKVHEAYEARDFFENLGGKDRYCYFLAAPIYDEKGEITAAIETVQDISKEKEMAEHLKQYAETLQNELVENINLREEIEQLYNYLQSIVNSLPDKIYDINGDGIINYVSRDMKGDRGIVSRKIKGKHFLDFVEPEHREYVFAKWNDAKKGIFLPYELEVIRRDGSKRKLLITPAPVKGTDRYVLVQRDITEFKHLEEKYYESKKLAAIGQLSAGIAHEVRNPLSSIKMSLQILEKRLKPSGNDLKRFKIAQREVDHLEKLVNDVLIYAKPAEPKNEESDIEAILEQALAMVEKSILDKQVHVVKKFKKIKLIQANSAMLEQAFINVYQNAIDAMEVKGALSISTKMVDTGDGSILIEIEDTGCGIDEEDMPHLFNPFFTRKKYGTGLGLTQVRKIIELHQGSIDILSRKGDGTRFIITLPL